MQTIVRRILALSATLLLLGTLMPVEAANTTVQPQPSGSGISISPLVSQYTLKPGDSQQVAITIRDVTVDDIVAEGSVNDFRSDGSTGNPVIITTNAPPTANSIRNFVSGVKNIPIAKGAQINTTVTLKIPKGTPAGAYFGVIRYKAVPAAAAGTNQSGNVALSASVGTIVLITVPGNIREQVQLTGIHAYSGFQGQTEKTLFTQKPTYAGIEIKNLGNGFEQPFGTVVIDNMFGKQVDTYQLNAVNATAPKGNVLPNSSRIFKQKISGLSQVGRYTITASVSYGNGSQVLVGRKTIWYAPAWLLIAILVVVLLLILGVFLAYRRYKKSIGRSYRRR